MYRNQSRRTKAVEDGASSRDSDLARPHPPPDAGPMYNDRMRHPKDRHAVKKATPNAPLFFSWFCAASERFAANGRPSMVSQPAK